MAFCLINRKLTLSKDHSAFRTDSRKKKKNGNGSKNRSGRAWGPVTLTQQRFKDCHSTMADNSVGARIPDSF